MLIATEFIFSASHNFIKNLGRMRLLMGVDLELSGRMRLQPHFSYSLAVLRYPRMF